MGNNGYGWTELLKFRGEDGALLTWFSSAAPEFDVGTELTLDGTVKAHKEYRGTKETLLTRVKVL